MKTRLWIEAAIIAFIVLSSCNDDKLIKSTQVIKSIIVSAQDFQNADAVTRGVLAVNGSGFHFSWTAGDTIGIYPVGGDQVAFPISSGEGSQTAQFDGGAWALRSSYSYAAYYPFSSGNYRVEENRIPVNYIGQVQNGNASLDDLDKFDYQASVATRPDYDGNVHIKMFHLGCLVRMRLTMPMADTLKSIMLTSSKTPFITSGVYDITKEQIAITSNTTSSVIYMPLLNTFTTPDNKILTIYFMLAPSDFSNSEISISIEGTKNRSYSTKVYGKKMFAGMFYDYTAVIKYGTNINQENVAWDVEGQEIKPKFEYVDLGLSVNWATFNVGAFTPEECGDHFSWGEIYPKDDYSWENYKWCNGSEKSLTKYNTNSYYGTVDNKITLDPEDDVAHVKWGGDWRMPTKEELEELRDNCTWTYAILNGVKGFNVSSNIVGYGNCSIFLPFDRILYNENINENENRGYYCSSSLYTQNTNFVYAFLLRYTNYWGIDPRFIDMYRIRDFSVRPVCPSEKYSTLCSIELSRKKITLSMGSNPIQIKATPKNNAGRALNADIQWASSDESIAIVASDGTITAINVGTCNVIASVNTIQSSCKITVTDVDENGYGYIDLGLSVNWATCNVGAEQPEDYGDYIAWGETEPYYEAGYAQEYPQSHWKAGKSAGYDWPSYKWCNGSSDTQTKYNTNSYYGTVDNKTTLDLEDDVAHVKWGGSWRIPTKEELDELCNKCSWTWYDEKNSEFDGIAGYKVTSNMPGYTERFIFLPAAGYCFTNSLGGLGYMGEYWSSSLKMDYPGAVNLIFSSSRVDVYSSSERMIGHSVRPVCPSDIFNNVSSIELNRNNISLSMGGKSIQIKAFPKNIAGSTITADILWSSSNESIAKVASDGTITPISEGECTIIASSASKKSYCEVVVTAGENGYGYVDLGLSVKWATCNVGAEQPEDFGNYYAWGEIETKDTYSWATYKHCKGTSDTQTKYVKYYYEYGYRGFRDNKYVLDLEDDVAHVKWGGGWRMPTLDEMQELTDKCYMYSTTLNGVNGFIIKSKVEGYTDCRIFLPAAGLLNDYGLDYETYYGLYWTKTNDTSDFDGASGITLRPNGGSVSVYIADNNHSSSIIKRYYGFSVRPVCP